MTASLAYVPDLMDRSKVAAAAPDTAFVATPDLLVPPADLAIVDLSRPGVLAALPALHRAGVRTLGFASHLDREGMAAARAAGCTEVLARSAFFPRLATLLP
jgi:beta-phosphoglucomutase-like phosphatase (HAD superfamily)